MAGNKQMKSAQSACAYMLVILPLLLFGCSASDDRCPDPAHEFQSCDSCNWSSVKVNLVDAIPTDSFKITTPTVIPFLNIYHGTCSDTAVRRKFNTLGNFRYDLISQADMFTSSYESFRDAGYTIVDSLGGRSVLFFEDDQYEYIVDLSQYDCRDGMLIFKPGNAPIFWTMDVYSDHCNDSTFASCCFKN